MSIFAIGDLHLSMDPKVQKPMDIFGDDWSNHDERLRQNWIDRITSDDTVIIAGDISWGIKLEEAMADLNWIHELPGRKIITKGNHDLWWAGINKLNSLYDDITFVQNTYAKAEGYAICGSRGWMCPGTVGFQDHDLKIYSREVLRLEMSLESARRAGCDKIIGVLHYPPTNENHQSSGFTDLFQKYDVRTVIYGHLHGRDSFGRGLQSVFNGVNYKLVSLDYVKAEPALIIV